MAYIFPYKAFQLTISMIVMLLCTFSIAFAENCTSIKSTQKEIKGLCFDWGELVTNDLSEKGLVVRTIKRNSLAYRAGVRTGDLIIIINELRITKKTYNQITRNGINSSGNKIRTTIHRRHWSSARITKNIDISWDIITLPTLLFSGVRQNVLIRELHGWRKCYSADYKHNTGTYMKDILRQCNGNKLLVGCRRSQKSDYLEVAAIGDRDHVLFDTGNNYDKIHEHNGVAWYYHISRSWGFVPAGNRVHKNICDGSRNPKSLCWHMEGSGGYSCGNKTGLYGSKWQKIIFTTSQ